jgi:hypothetical protein
MDRWISRVGERTHRRPASASVTNCATLSLFTTLSRRAAPLHRCIPQSLLVDLTAARRLSVSVGRGNCLGSVQLSTSATSPPAFCNKKCAHFLIQRLCYRSPKSVVLSTKTFGHRKPVHEVPCVHPSLLRHSLSDNYGDRADGPRTIAVVVGEVPHDFRFPFRGRTVQDINHRLHVNDNTHTLNQPKKHIPHHPSLPTNYAALALPGPVVVSSNSSTVRSAVSGIRAARRPLAVRRPLGEMMAPHEAGPRSEHVAALDLVEQRTSSRAPLASPRSCSLAMVGRRSHSRSTSLGGVGPSSAGCSAGTRREPLPMRTAVAYVFRRRKGGCTKGSRVRGARRRMVPLCSSPPRAR